MSKAILMYEVTRLDTNYLREAPLSGSSLTVNKTFQLINYAFFQSKIKILSFNIKAI